MFGSLLEAYLCSFVLSDEGRTVCECSGCTSPLCSTPFCRSSTGAGDGSVMIEDKNNHEKREERNRIGRL